MSAFDRISAQLPRWATFVSCAALVAWPTPTFANMSYRDDVDAALGKPMVLETKIAPPMGCQLCHTNPNGGTLTLTTFANYMIAEYDFPKTSVPEDELVKASLARLMAAQPSCGRTCRTASTRTRTRYSPSRRRPSPSTDARRWLRGTRAPGRPRSAASLLRLQALPRGGYADCVVTDGRRTRRLPRWPK